MLELVLVTYEEGDRDVYEDGEKDTRRGVSVVVEELARAASVNIIDLGVDLLLFSSNCDDLVV